jgi:hypothetical protein
MGHTAGGMAAGRAFRLAPCPWAAPTGFCDSRGNEVLWVGVCAPHGWNLTEISVRNTVKSRQIRRWTAEIRQIFQR